MDALFPLLFSLCFVGFCLLAVAGFFALVIVLAREYGKKTDRTWRRVTEKFGMTYGRDEDTNPFIRGRLHDVDVLVSTKRTIQWVTRSDSSHRKPMIWTHVIASPVFKPAIEVWLCKNKVPERPGLTALETGDAEFSERYQLFGPETADADEVCPPSVASCCRHPATCRFSMNRSSGPMPSSNTTNND